MYKPKYFKLYEFIYPEKYNEYSRLDKLNNLWGCMDDRILITCDRLRAYLGIPVIINTWHRGGVYKESGLRASTSATGADISQHKYGRACDLKFNSAKWSPEKLRNHMLIIGAFKPGFLDRTDDIAAPFVLISRIEWLKNMNWFHMDTSSTGNTDRSIAIIRG